MGLRHGERRSARVDPERDRQQFASVETCLLDLGFPCHLACVECDRTPERADAYHAARRKVLAAFHARRAEVLRLIFHGGDPFTLPSSFAELLEEAAEAGRARGIEIEGVALTDGTAWALDRVRDFEALGVTEYHVAIDGPAFVQDKARPGPTGEPSYARVLNSLKWHRNGARVEVRADVSQAVATREELQTAFEREGLLRGPAPVKLTFGRRQSCRQHAIALLRYRNRVARVQ